MARGHSAGTKSIAGRLFRIQQGSPIGTRRLARTSAGPDRFVREGGCRLLSVAMQSAIGGDGTICRRDHPRRSTRVGGMSPPMAERGDRCLDQTYAHMRKYILFLMSMASVHASFCQPTPLTVHPSTTRHGPEHGSLLIIGGNVGSFAFIWNKFTELAGGKEKAHIVVVTAAAGDSAAFDQRDVDVVKKQTGIRDVVLLHTSSLREANS